MNRIKSLMATNSGKENIYHIYIYMYIGFGSQSANDFNQEEVTKHNAAYAHAHFSVNAQTKSLHQLSPVLVL